MTLFLLVLNLVALAVGAGVEYSLANRPSDLREFNAGKIRFWLQPETYKPAATKPDKPALADAAPALPGRLCLEIADLNQARFADMQAVLKTAGIEGGKCVYSFDKKLGWWVFWPPEYEAAQRDKVLTAIRDAGVKDVLPVNQGAMAQAFSLGVFSGEGQANQYRDALRGKGLDKVEFGPRPSMGSGRLGCMSGEPGQLDRLKAGLPSWVKPIEDALCPGLSEPVAAQEPR